jgi:hypothetical protein
MRDVFGGMARTTKGPECVRCHLEYVDHLALLSHSQALSYATADSGADTNVLGQEWLIVSTDPIKKINLVGFDAAYARKRGLSIVTADTIVPTEDGDETILRASQSFSNPSTSTTLLSEVQLRHVGHVVDSVHKSHLLSTDGTKGTQSLYLRQYVKPKNLFFYKIPFIQRAGLMTFAPRKPDLLDYHRNLPIVSLTMETKWDPQAHYDDHGELVITPLESDFMAQSSCFAEPIQPAQSLPSWHHGETYSICILVDDIIVISKDPMDLITQIKKTYSLKGIGVPEYCLGGNFHQIDDPSLNAAGIKR